VQVPTDHQIVENRHGREEPEILKGAGDPAAGDGIGGQAEQRITPEPDRPQGGPVDAGDAVEQGRLSGTVGADDGERLALAEGQADPLQGGDPAERQAEAADLQERRQKCG
jgi:hypothetical protein